MKWKAAATALAMFGFTLQGRAADAPPFLGDYDPEEECEGPLSSPVCAYKTWFYCRVADADDMCAFVMGQGPRQQWDDEPWTLPLTELVQGPLDVYGYAFIGSRTVTADRIGRSQSRLARRLVGTTEVMDTYSDPNEPGVSYIGSEFYAETRPGQWRIVGWTLSAEGGDGDLPCTEPGDESEDVCKMRVEGIPSWADLMRGGQLK